MAEPSKRGELDYAYAQLLVSADQNIGIEVTESYSFLEYCDDGRVFRHRPTYTKYYFTPSQTGKKHDIPTIMIEDTNAEDWYAGLGIELHAHRSQGHEPDTHAQNEHSHPYRFTCTFNSFQPDHERIPIQDRTNAPRKSTENDYRLGDVEYSRVLLFGESSPSKYGGHPNAYKLDASQYRTFENKIKETKLDTGRVNGHAQDLDAELLSRLLKSLCEDTQRIHGLETQPAILTHVRLREIIEEVAKLRKGFGFKVSCSTSSGLEGGASGKESMGEKLGNNPSSLRLDSAYRQWTRSLASRFSS